MCGCIERYNQKERATQPTPFLIETFCERAFNELTVSFKIHQSNNNFKMKKKNVLPTYPVWKIWVGLEETNNFLWMALCAG